jgi:large subunit ribosomal protein L15
LKLAQKYGYQLNDFDSDPLKEMFEMEKDPRQCWHGLEPGWVVNLTDKLVLKPTDKEWIDYYND